VRKQFLIMTGAPILAFVEKKTKFHECSSFTDITANVACKEVPGLAFLDPRSTTATDGRTLHSICQGIVATNSQGYFLFTFEAVLQHSKMELCWPPTISYIV
jgi:hypothetical protein